LKQYVRKRREWQVASGPSSPDGYVAAVALRSGGVTSSAGFPAGLAGAIRSNAQEGVVSTSAPTYTCHSTDNNRIGGTTMMLTPENTTLVLVDVQEKLFALMHEKDRLLDRLERLLKGAIALNVPIVWVEQIPEKMGPTITPLGELLGERSPICKTSFSAWGAERFVRSIVEIGHEHVLLAGIESHVCVYQTAVDLLEEHREVHVVADAVSSRTASDCRIGLHRIESAGGCLTSVEMALFELMRTSTHEAFRNVLRIVK